MSNKHINEEDKEIYQQGRMARTANKSDESCPYGYAQMKQRNWWLCGWHTRDQELGFRRYGG